MTPDTRPLHTLALKYKNGLRYGKPAYWYCPANVYPAWVRKKARYLTWEQADRKIPSLYKQGLAGYIKAFERANNLVSLP
jgi:hypothetical protein